MSAKPQPDKTKKIDKQSTAHKEEFTIDRPHQTKPKRQDQNDRAKSNPGSNIDLERRRGTSTLRSSILELACFPARRAEKTKRIGRPKSGISIESLGSSSDWRWHPRSSLESGFTRSSQGFATFKTGPVIFRLRSEEICQSSLSRRAGKEVKAQVEVLNHRDGEQAP